MRELPLFGSSDGGTQALWQRRDMIVARLHGGCAGCEALDRSLRAKLPRLSEVGLVVVPPELGAPLDAACERTGAYVAIANRFLLLYAVVDAHGASAPERAEEIAGWLEYAQKSCGECQPPFEPR
jgi:hypothetical protein